MPNGDPSSSHTHTPSLSITKVPAPQPVQLPTEDDLFSSPTYSSPTETTRVYDVEQDEEMGESRMREVDRMTPVQANYPSSVNEATLVPLPPPSAVSPSNPLSPAPTIDTHSEPPNLQTMDNFDSQNLLTPTAPADPSPASAIMDEASMSDATLSSDVPTPPLADSSDSNFSGPQVAKEEEPQTSVRLVGGGGITGDVVLVDDAVPDTSGLGIRGSSDAASNSSIDRRKKEAV